MSALIVVVILGLCYCSKESSSALLGRPVLFGPSVALVDDVVDFFCEVETRPEGKVILLQLFKEDNRSKVLGESSSINKEIGVFPLIITSSHEGYLECEASMQNITLKQHIPHTVSERHYLKVVEPVKEAEIFVQSGEEEFFEGKTLQLRCAVKAGNHVTYSWMLNGRLVSHSPRRYAAENQLFVYRPTSQDSGYYMCVATNQFNMTEIYTSNSSAVKITVKDVVSNPEISFIVSKEASNNYSALVTCQSARGTPPLTFSLYNRTEFVANVTGERLNVTFTIPVVLGRHMGWIQCRAENGNQVAYSEWMPLEVVPVEGPLAMTYDFDTGENFAVIGLRFYCKVAKGTHPRYQWFLNETHLVGQGTFYRVFDQPPQQSVLLLAVGKSSAGTYHCEASDTFQPLNRTVIKSESRYIDKEVLNRLPISVVAVVFGCFIFLVSLVAICCAVGVACRRREYEEKKSLWNAKKKRDLVAYEEDLRLEDYREDVDVVNAARIDYPYPESEPSIDEWPQIEREKKTLEDEPPEWF